MKKVIALIFCAVFLVGIVSSCTTGQVNKEKAVQTQDLGSSENKGTPVSGGSISIFSYKPDTLCPILTNNKANIQMLNIVFESLINVGTDMTAKPVLATSWNVSENGLVWTFNLRDNVAWHDGGVFTSKDVEYTINQIKAKKDGYYFYNVEDISRLKCLSDDQISVTLKEPKSNFVNLLTFPIIKYQSGKIDASSYIPIGTGPFNFEDRNEGNMYHLNRNDNWWNGKAYLDSIMVKLLPDKDTALYSFSSGDIDLTIADNSDWGKFVDSSNTKYLTMPTSRYNFIGINNENQVLRFQEVRQALGLLIDRKSLINDVLMGYASPANAPLNNSWELYNKSFSSAEYNKQKAKDILTENGWQSLDKYYMKKDQGKTYKLELEILVNKENATREEVADTISKELNEFGIKTTVKKVKFDEYNSLINKKRYDLFIGGCELSDDLDFRFLFDIQNIFNCKDSDIIQATGDLQNQVTDDTRKTAYSSFMELFSLKMPIIGLYFEDDVMLYNTRLKGGLEPSSNKIYNGIEKIYVNTSLD